jgi:hypothetical protein
VPISGYIVHPPDEYKYGELWRNVVDNGKPKNLEKNL